MKKTLLGFGLIALLSASMIALAITTDNSENPICPICKMQIDASNSAVQLECKNGTIDFCNDGCKDKFCENPTAFLSQEELDNLGICTGGDCTDCTDCKDTASSDCDCGACDDCKEKAKAAATAHPDNCQCASCTAEAAEAPGAPDCLDAGGCSGCTGK